MVKNIIITGIGGQGVVTLAGILRWAALSAGLSLTGSDNRGGAQRLGHVSALIRVTDQKSMILAPEIPAGSCDLLLSLECSEGLRFFPTLGKQSRVWVSPKIFIPTNERRRKAPYIDLPGCLAAYESIAQQVRICDFVKEARDRLGDGRLGNLVALGAVVGSLEIPALSRFLARNLQEPDRSAFQHGLTILI